MTGPFLLDAPLSTPWYVAGSADATMAVTIDTVSFTVTPTSAGTTVSVGGSGQLLSTDLDGSAGTPVPLAITSGQLGSGPDGGVLNATFSAAGTWTDVLGADGIDASAVEVSVTTSGGSLDRRR